MTAKILHFPTATERATQPAVQARAAAAAAQTNPHRSGMAPASAWDRLLGAAGVPESEVTTTTEEK